MNGHTFATLPEEKKEKIIRSAIRDANREQKRIVEEAKKISEKK